MDFLLGAPGRVRHPFLCRRWARRQRWSPPWFLRPRARAHRDQSTRRATLERIALLPLEEPALPDPMVDPELEKRPASPAGGLTDLSR